MDFHYSGQVRRYLLQFMRTFMHINIESEEDENGSKSQSRVPVLYGDPSWMVAQLMKDGSENTMIPSPVMAAWILKLEMDPKRRNDPAFESKVNAIERKFDNVTKKYTEEVGQRYTIERYMPVPYKISFQLDIWTTNTTTKLQILEQILTIFNPMLQLQHTDNRFDWSSIFEVELVDIKWSNRSVPTGTEMERDVASLVFDVPIWVNPPAKLKRISIIEQIVTNVLTVDEVPEIPENSFDPFGCIGGKPEQITVTPGNFKISIGTDGYANNEIVLRNQYGVDDPALSWEDLFTQYGEINKDITRIRILQSDNIEDFENSIVGTVEVDPTRKNILLADIDPDTLPSHNYVVNAVVNPVEFFDDNPSVGDRYLITSDFTNGEETAMPDDTPWGMHADPNDIIAYDGAEWYIDFDSAIETDTKYTFNSETNESYKWNGTEWEYTYYGQYAPGHWRLENIFRPLKGSDD